MLIYKLFIRTLQFVYNLKQVLPISTFTHQCPFRYLVQLRQHPLYHGATYFIIEVKVQAVKDFIHSVIIHVATVSSGNDSYSL